MAKVIVGNNSYDNVEGVMFQAVGGGVVYFLAKGLESIVMNDDYTLTITYSDKTSYTTPSIKGSPGNDGKTAYQYAQDGGYTGTEAEFAEKLAKEYPKNLSALNNDVGFITSAGAPVKSVNGKSGAVMLSASDVGARPENWMPTADQVGAEKSGAASSEVSAHNTKTDAHNDIRLLISALRTELNALANSDDDTLDQMAEVVAYIKANRDLIEQVTTGKVSVSSIIDNLTTNVADKPLSAAQGVALKTLIDALGSSLAHYQPKGNYLTSIPSEYVTEDELAEKGYLTQHQDISGKLDANKLTEAIDEALAQAKASGEFDGSSVTVKSVSESTASGGSNVVTFTDGKTVTIKNGKDGAPGKTPEKGADYYTAEDKQEMVNAVISALPVYAGEVI